MSFETRYAARKRQEFHDRANSQAGMASTLQLRAACEQTAREVAARWPETTVENAAEIIRFQLARIEELKREFAAEPVEASRERIAEVLARAGGVTGPRAASTSRARDKA